MNKIETVKKFAEEQKPKVEVIYEKKSIVIVRGIHMNELSAFELAERVYFKIKEQEINCSLETVPFNQSAWSTFNTLNNNLTLTKEEVEKVLEDKIIDEFFLTYHRRRTHRIYSFHNYPVSFEPRKYGSGNQFETGIIEADRLCKIEEVHDETKAHWAGEIVFFPHRINGCEIVEIPAFYKTQKRFNIPALDGNIVEGYLYNVDLPTTRDQGLLSDRIVEEITKRIIGKHYKKILRGER